MIFRWLHHCFPSFSIGIKCKLNNNKKKKKYVAEFCLTIQVLESNLAPVILLYKAWITCNKITTSINLNYIDKGSILKHNFYHWSDSRCCHSVQFRRTRLMSHAHRLTLLVHVKFTTPSNNWLDPVITGFIRT